MSEEKTILVKKKDGTFVKMKLSDLKKNSSVSNISKIVKEEINPDAKRKIVLGNSFDKKEKFLLTKDDIKSPLEDEDLKKIDHKTFNTRENEAEEILKQIDFKVAKQAEENLKKALVFLLKDLKSEEQIEELLAQPVYLGGADLSKERIKEFIKIVSDKKTQFILEKHNPVIPFKKKGGAVNLPMKEGEILPSASSPFNSFVHKPPFSKKVKEIKSLDELMENSAVNREDISQILSYGKPEQKKVEDILPPKEFVYGPIDEIKNFNLTDFRRLSSKTEEATNRLKQKFINLKEESFLFYLQALEAWQQSPLYKQYMQKICDSLNQGITLKELSKNENEIKEEEIKFLLKMEKEI